MVTHELKSWPKFFAPLSKGSKTFEIRQNDRHYQIGDVLHLKEWDPTAEGERGDGRFTGRSCRRLVTDVLTAEDLALDGIGGLVPGFVLLSLWRVTMGGVELNGNEQL